MRIRNVAPNVQQAAEQMRHVPTSAEERLWNALRGQQIAGTKFRRQASMGRFILDFYAPSCKLVIEADGSIHEKQVERDGERTRYLQTYGCSVLRVRNEDVLDNLPAVLALIEETINSLHNENLSAETLKDKNV